MSVMRNTWSRGVWVAFWIQVCWERIWHILEVNHVLYRCLCRVIKYRAKLAHDSIYRASYQAGIWLLFTEGWPFNGQGRLVADNSLGTAESEWPLSSTQTVLYLARSSNLVPFPKFFGGTSPALAMLALNPLAFLRKRMLPVEAKIFYVFKLFGVLSSEKLYMHIEKQVASSDGWFPNNMKGKQCIPIRLVLRIKEIGIFARRP